MARPEIDLGPTTRRVSEAVKSLREFHGLSFAELERRLAAVGRPIPSLGLRNIEAGKRRIDVDELVALAEVLGVTPISLLVNEGKMTDAEFLDVVLATRPDMGAWLKRENLDENLSETMRVLMAPVDPTALLKTLMEAKSMFAALAEAAEVVKSTAEAAVNLRSPAEAEVMSGVLVEAVEALRATVIPERAPDRGDG